MTVQSPDVSKKTVHEYNPLTMNFWLSPTWLNVILGQGMASFLCKGPESGYYIPPRIRPGLLVFPPKYDRVLHEFSL